MSIQNNTTELQAILETVNSLPEAGSGEEYEEYLGEILGIGTLENTSWADVKTIGASGGAENYWAVGDTKRVELNGTVGAITFANETYLFCIAGFNHNEEYEGKGIHFMLAKNPVGVNTAFTDSSNVTQGSTAGFRFNLQNSNNGGWRSSYLRNTICQAVFDAFPEELQNVIGECVKYSDNVGNKTTAASSITALKEKVFIPSEFEIFGVRDVANPTEQTYQKQYAYFKAGNTKVKYCHDKTAEQAYWWSRSPDCSNNTNVRAFYSDSSNYGYAANYSFGIVPFFKVG